MTPGYAYVYIVGVYISISLPSSKQRSLINTSLPVNLGQMQNMYHTTAHLPQPSSDLKSNDPPKYL